jgi:GNAT superfamily N-acetyltransferase
VTEAARPATAADLATLVLLHRAATAELQEEKGGVLWARQTGRQSPPGFDLDNPGQLTLAGTIDDAVVGYARLVIEALPAGGSLAVLTDIYVEAGARGVGVGEALLDAAIAWARSQGCVGIDSIALPGMRASKNFFEAAGLVARAIIVHKPL